MTALLTTAKSFIHRLVASGDSSRSILPFVPRPLRLLFLLLLVLNSRSLPFVWHFRVFRPVLFVRLRWFYLFFSSRHTRDAWLDSLSAVGKSPFALQSTYTTWASPDESDYNMHLSNSSYAKVLDMLRLKFALTHISTLFRDGAWIALGATHLKFMREIPFGKSYEIRMYIGSWDAKWMYIVARYVSKSAPESADSKTRRRLQDAKEVKDLLASSSAASSTGVPLPQLHTPVNDSASGSNTPNATPATAAAAGFDSLWAESPGETLHCIAVNEVCFKLGRVTVPPALALASAGCGLGPEQWAAAKRLRAAHGPKSKSKDGKGEESMSMRKLLLGAWREVPAGARWWEDALAPFEAERVRRLAVLQGLRGGLEAAKSL